MKRLLFAVFVVVACSGARSVLVDTDPTTPNRTACTRGAWRCNGLVPEHCDTDESGSGVTRWWPAHGLGADLASAPCALACVVDDGGPAHCDGIDAGTDGDR